VHNLLHGGRLPLFEPVQSGRVSAVRLEQQPDDAVPRFQYEDHIRSLVKDRVWPDSTRAISELRITLDYQSASGWNRFFSPGRLSIDIVDYPGEWLLDLPLLDEGLSHIQRRDRRAGWQRYPRRTLAELAGADAPLRRQSFGRRNACP
jgi:predicted YcjX-like family ATPase